MLLKIIASKARWQEREFRKVVPGAETLIFFDEPLGKDGETVRREDLQTMLQDYCALRSWSPEGIPF